MTRKVQPEADRENERVEWTYWISRDSIAGVLSAKCSLWGAKPVRRAKDGNVTWGNKADTAYMGEWLPAHLASRFGTYPETDLELIRADTRPSQQEWADAKAKQS